MSLDRNLSEFAARILLAQSHDLPVTVNVGSGIYTGRVRARTLERPWKYGKDPGRSPVLVEFEDGSVIRLDEMEGVRLGP